MPLVVDNQAEKFRTDPLMVELSATSQPTTIRFAGCPHAREPERQQTFLTSCQQKRLFITVPGHGLNFDLTLEKVQMADDVVEFDSPLILNGVCVRWKGRIHKSTLEGHGRIEFDTARAEQEERRANTDDKPFERRVTQLRELILGRNVSQQHQ